MAQENRHNDEVAKLAALWAEQQHHLEHAPPKERKRLRYMAKHLDFEPQVRRHLQAADRMMPFVRGRVLEWGCNHAPDSAIFTMRLGDRIECHGADVRDGRLFTPFHAYSGVRYRRLSDPVALPYPDDHFDTVIGHGVLEHVPDPEASLGELHRVLRPGGTLLIEALPNRRSYTEAWLRLTRGAAHARRYSPAGIEASLRAHGFVVLRMERVGMLPRMLLRARPRIRRAYAGAVQHAGRLETVLERSPLSAFAASLSIAARAERAGGGR